MALSVEKLRRILKRMQEEPGEPVAVRRERPFSSPARLPSSPPAANAFPEGGGDARPPAWTAPPLPETRRPDIGPNPLRRRPAVSPARGLGRFRAQGPEPIVERVRPEPAAYPPEPVWEEETREPAPAEPRVLQPEKDRHTPSVARWGLWRRLAPWLCAGVAIAGTILGDRWLMGLGWLGLIVHIYWSTGKASAASESDDISSRMLRLERRYAALSSIQAQGGGGGISPELEEEIQELRTLVKSLYKALQEPPEK